MNIMKICLPVMVILILNIILLKILVLFPKIFEDNWEDFYNTNKELVDKYRPNADFEISKIIDCMNKDLSCSVYQCPDCGDFIFAFILANLGYVLLVVTNTNLKESIIF